MNVRRFRSFWSPFARKQRLAAKGGSRYYGDGGTIHGSGELDVEVDSAGQVVAVWFRCQHLPFGQHPASERRAAQMRSLYSDPPPALTGVEVVNR